MIDGRQLSSAVQSVVTDGPAAGCRAVDLRVWNGVDLRLLPDRGLDCGAAWFRGAPLAWTSPVGEGPPLDHPRGDDWATRFGGGLVATCGLRNVGAPSEGHGLHGSFSHQRAGDVRVERGGDRLTVRATVVEADALGFAFEVQRRWTTFLGRGLVELSDITRNVGREPEPAPLLYRVNLGAPLWSEGATLDIAGHRAALPRDEAAAVMADSWRRAPAVAPGARERVLEHQFDPGPDGWASATITSPATGLRLTARWDAATLPRLHQQVNAAPSLEVLSLEPANASLAGRAADRAAGRLPVLEPGAERITRMTFEVV
jgi:Domain of unknown function (DUF4432)